MKYPDLEALREISNQLRRWLEENDVDSVSVKCAASMEHVEVVSKSGLSYGWSEKP